MNNVEFLASGDLHIDGLNNLFPNYSFDPNNMIYKALQQVIDFAIENNIQHIVLLGDVFHHPNPSQHLQMELLKFLSKYKNLFFYVIAGNHDYLNVDSVSLQMAQFISLVSNEFKHIKFFTKSEFQTIEGVPFSFLPWPNCKTLLNPSVNIAHVEIAGSKADNGRTLSNGYKISKNGVWYIGHLHRRQEYIDKNVYYPGMLYQRTFGEPVSPKGFYHVIVKYKPEKLSYEHEFVSIEPPYKLKNIKINKQAGLTLVKKPQENIVQYKILMRNGVELPVGFRETYPNVIEITGKLSAKELSSLKQNNYQTDLINSDIDYLEGFEAFLEKEGCSIEQIKKAKAIVEGYLK